MKRFHSMLIAIIALVLFAPLAQAQPRPWDQVITNNRFRVLSDFNDAAVLDRETGLVWEQSPDGVIQQTWFNAQSECNRKSVGGRRGWRLPTIQELASLVDPNNPGGNPALPAGHPFNNVQSSEYWSATTSANITGGAWGVDFADGSVDIGDKFQTGFVWCVRGGQGVDPQ